MFTAVQVLRLVAAVLGFLFGRDKFPSYMWPGVAIGCYMAVVAGSGVCGAVLGAFSSEGILYWTGEMAVALPVAFAAGHIGGYLFRCLRNLLNK